MKHNAMILQIYRWARQGLFNRTVKMNFSVNKIFVLQHQVHQQPRQRRKLSLKTVIKERRKQFMTKWKRCTTYYRKKTQPKEKDEWSDIFGELTAKALMYQAKMRSSQLPVTSATFHELAVHTSYTVENVYFNIITKTPRQSILLTRHQHILKCIRNLRIHH